ncbi:hypothetical protein [Actinopolymorpha sp. B9G3]|uniref:hypothetical protein n=1 Tax=Actinopolymorpha sp. B9G3 TaxID=3158970 RepID=UPI0032D8EB11
MTEPEGWAVGSFVDYESVARQHAERGEWEPAQVYATLEAARQMGRVADRAGDPFDAEPGDGESDAPETGTGETRRHAGYDTGARAHEVDVLDDEYSFDRSFVAERYLVTFWTKVAPDTWFQGQQLVGISNGDVTEVIEWAVGKTAEQNAAFFQIDVVVPDVESGDSLLRVAGPDDPQVGD